jgi:hypothetical protein
MSNSLIIGLALLSYGMTSAEKVVAVNFARTQRTSPDHRHMRCSVLCFNLSIRSIPEEHGIREVRDCRVSSWEEVQRVNTWATVPHIP